MQVMWKRLYKSYSVCERGTLYQLRNILNRTNVKPNPKDNVNAAHDFIDIITMCHILAATMELFNMTDLQGVPNDDDIDLDEDTWMLPNEERKKIFSLVCHKIVNTYTNFKFDWLSPPEPSVDGMYAYAVEVLSLGLFYLSFKDAIRHGNGLQVLRCWKYFIPIFKASGRTNYSIEAFITLYQYYFTLSPRQSHQLIWSRFVNTRGQPDHNIECDLHMEHLNRLCKNAIKGMGANKTEKAIQRAAKAIGKTSAVVDNFNRISKLSPTSNKHSSPNVSKDRDLIIKELVDNKVFKVFVGREHKSFKKIRNSIMTEGSESQLKEWIKSQILTFV